jgi:hypothetical protein
MSGELRILMLEDVPHSPAVPAEAIEALLRASPDAAIEEESHGYAY